RMFEFTLTAVASLFFVVDPLAAVPAYLVMTEGDAPAKTRQTAWKASLAATLCLAIFAAAGEGLFRLFGLSMPAFQIAGGLMLFMVALDMLRAQRPTKEGPGELDEGKEKEDVAITPLAIPMLAGPASLATVAVLMSHARDWRDVVVVYLAILLVGVAS